MKALDGGDIYCKQPINISEGNANEIFKRASDIKFNKMIPFIIKNKPAPKKQEGKTVKFKRRTPEQSEISQLKDLRVVHDYIRMLDGEGYPKAFIETNDLRVEFSNAKMEKNKIIAVCEITSKGKHGKK